jgi:geranylgeranyl reductase family protein
MDNVEFDVTIVGGGPAGTTAAIHLARGGFRVCLVEKETHPRIKVCGGGVLARAVQLLPVSVETAVEQRCDRVEIHFWGKELAFCGKRDNPIIYMVMRAEMDALLMGEAKRCGVTVLENCQARDLARESGHVALHTDRDTISSRFLIAADGVYSVVAQSGGWEVNMGAIPAVECEVSVDPATFERFKGRARFDLDLPRTGYSWIFPKKDHLSIGVLNMSREGGGLRELLHEYLEGMDIRYSPPLKLRGAMIPVRPRTGAPVKGRILLVGDAAGLAEPICAEGITNALRSGILAAKAIAEGGLDPEKVASKYIGEMEKVYRELEIAGHHARVIYGSRPLRNLLFRLKGEKFCDRLIDVMTGEMEFNSFGGPLRLFFG